jgi:hypothetical protein
MNDFVLTTTVNSKSEELMIRIPCRESNASPEKRGDNRYTVRWPVLLGQGRGEGIGDVCDISVGGIFVHAFGELADAVYPGQGVYFSCQLSSGAVASMRGRVRWVGESEEHQCKGFGLRLDENGIVLEDEADTQFSVLSMGTEENV